MVLWLDKLLIDWFYRLTDRLLVGCWWLILTLVRDWSLDSLRIELNPVFKFNDVYINEFWWPLLIGGLKSWMEEVRSPYTPTPPSIFFFLIICFFFFLWLELAAANLLFGEREWWVEDVPICRVCCRGFIYWYRPCVKFRAPVRTDEFCKD